jgi:hypothetical protein
LAIVVVLLLAELVWSSLAPDRGCSASVIDRNLLILLLDCLLSHDVLLGEFGLSLRVQLLLREL